jgi:hypothetical protein
VHEVRRRRITTGRRVAEPEISAWFRTEM